LGGVRGQAAVMRRETTSEGVAPEDAPGLLYEASELARDPLLIWVELGELGAITSQRPYP
jgi:hypothetical protein